MDYSQLSDRDIDALVLQKIYGSQSTDKDIMRSWLKGGFKFTSSPADAWPIIIDNKIKIEPMRRVRNYNEWYEEWDASVNSPHFCESHKNPLRAAMIVFLLSQDDKHA